MTTIIAIYDGWKFKNTVQSLPKYVQYFAKY